MENFIKTTQMDLILIYFVWSRIREEPDRQTEIDKDRHCKKTKLRQINCKKERMK